MEFIQSFAVDFAPDHKNITAAVKQLDTGSRFKTNNTDKSSDNNSSYSNFLKNRRTSNSIIHNQIVRQIRCCLAYISVYP